jgi:hypothetical protein
MRERASEDRRAMAGAGSFVWHWQPRCQWTPPASGRARVAGDSQAYASRTRSTHSMSAAQT